VKVDICICSMIGSLGFRYESRMYIRCIITRHTHRSAHRRRIYLTELTPQYAWSTTIHDIDVYTQYGPRGYSLEIKPLVG